MHVLYSIYSFYSYSVYHTLLHPYYTLLVALSHGSQGGEPPLRPLVGQKNT